MKKAGQNSFSIKKVLIITLIAGTLDGMAAVIFLAKMNFTGVFQYIASAVFGKEAFVGGIKMTLFGLLMHYLIAFTFTLFYNLVAQKATFLYHNKILSGIFYGIFAWSVMNLIIVPLTKIPHGVFNTEKAIINCVILIFCIGLPIAILTARRLKN